MEIRTKGLGRALIISGIAFTVVIVLWPILMVISEPAGTIEQQLTAINADSSMYKLNFAVASLIGPLFTLVMVLLVLYPSSTREKTWLEVVGLLFLPVYLVLVSIAYSSQYVLLPALLTANRSEDAKLWLFASDFSIPYLLNQLGYCFLGISALFIGHRFLSCSGIARVIGWLLWVMGITSILAFVGLALANPTLNSLTVVSGLLTLPLGILVALLGVKLNRKAMLTLKATAR